MRKILVRTIEEVIDALERNLIEKTGVKIMILNTISMPSNLRLIGPPDKDSCLVLSEEEKEDDKNTNS